MARQRRAGREDSDRLCRHEGQRKTEKGRERRAVALSQAGGPGCRGAHGFRTARPSGGLTPRDRGDSDHHVRGQSKFAAWAMITAAAACCLLLLLLLLLLHLRWGRLVFSIRCTSQSGRGAARDQRDDVTLSNPPMHHLFGCADGEESSRIGEAVRATKEMTRRPTRQWMIISLAPRLGCAPAGLDTTSGRPRLTGLQTDPSAGREQSQC